VCSNVRWATHVRPQEGGAAVCKGAVVPCGSPPGGDRDAGVGVRRNSTATLDPNPLAALYPAVLPDANRSRGPGGKR